MSLEERSCFLQSFLAEERYGRHDGNLLRVVVWGPQLALDFKGHSFCQETRFLIRILRSSTKDFRVHIQWREHYYLAAVGNRLVIENTVEPSQPKYQFIMKKARPSRAFTFKNRSWKYILSDDNGQVFLGPGSSDDPRAWVLVTFLRAGGIAHLYDEVAYV